MKIASVVFDAPIPLDAVFFCDMRVFGVPLYIGITTCGDHYHIGALLFDAHGESDALDIDGGKELRKYPSIGDCLIALAQVVREYAPDMRIDEIPFTIGVDVDLPALKYQVAKSAGDSFGGMADFKPSHKGHLN